MTDIKFVLNGEEKIIEHIMPAMRLLDVLREHYGLIGVKEGCGEGECGGCAVLLNHKIVNSCVTPIANVHGMEVITIEGFIESPRGQAIQKAFEGFGSVQCGICTPGMVIATESLLNANPNPSEEEIRQGLSGNLCRCTGYNMIIEAISYLAKEGGELW